MGCAKARNPSYSFTFDEGGHVTDFDDGEEGYVRVGTPVNIGEVDDPEIKDLLYNFESVGFNCEFGLVQRRYAAEPLGLLRWTTTRPDVLTKLLANRFAGVGSPQQTHLQQASWGELLLFDPEYEFWMHTFTHESGVNREMFLANQCRRLQFLANKLVADLAAGDKVLVYQAAEIPNAGIIHQLVRSYGTTALMLVHLADHTHPAGSVVAAGQGLFHGYISHFGIFQHETGYSYWDIDFASWVSICQAVLAIQKPVVLPS